ncbi:hypothetical protein ABNQ38_07775 (plasmid) [Azospirillum sp. A29]|uniref:hypothetical protein n=1 Tax=Azospirillum sp. A29 TaxID=3160606 RepID=UPI00367157C9
MPDDALLAALASKRAELDEQRSRLSSQLAALEREVASLDHTMRLFVRSEKLASPPQPRRKPLAHLIGLRRGEVGHDAQTILRKASRALTAQDIAHAVCARRGLALRAEAFEHLCRLVIKNLRRFEKRGVVQAVGYTPRQAVLWRPL